MEKNSNWDSRVWYGCSVGFVGIDDDIVRRCGIVDGQGSRVNRSRVKGRERGKRESVFCV